MEMAKMVTQRTFFDDDFARDMASKKAGAPLDPPYVAESETSAEAAASVAPVTGDLRNMVLNHIRRSGGATCDECEVALELAHQTCSARVTELRKLGLIVDSGQKRKTRSNRNAAVWEARS